MTAQHRPRVLIGRAPRIPVVGIDRLVLRQDHNGPPAEVLERGGPTREAALQLARGSAEARLSDQPVALCRLAVETRGPAGQGQLPSRARGGGRRHDAGGLGEIRHTGSFTEVAHDAGSTAGVVRIELRYALVGARSFSGRRERAQPGARSASMCAAGLGALRSGSGRQASSSHRPAGSGFAGAVHEPGLREPLERGRYRLRAWPPAGPDDQPDVAADQLGTHHRSHAAERGALQCGEDLIIDAALVSVHGLICRLFAERLVGLRGRGVLAVPGSAAGCVEVRPRRWASRCHERGRASRALLQWPGVPGAQGALVACRRRARRQSPARTTTGCRPSGSTPRRPAPGAGRCDPPAREVSPGAGCGRRRRCRSSERQVVGGRLPGRAARRLRHWC